MSAFSNYIPRTGDIALYRKWWLPPSGEFWPWVSGWFIVAKTWSWKTHAGTVIVEDGVANVCDAADAGVDIRPLADDVQRGDSILIRRPLPFVKINNEFLIRLCHLAKGKVLYGYAELAENLLPEAFGGNDRPDPDGMPPRAACSQWVSYLTRASMTIEFNDGVVIPFDPAPSRPDIWTTPGCLDVAELLYTVCNRIQLRV